jgi:hypothetical protein
MSKTSPFSNSLRPKPEIVKVVSTKICMEHFGHLRKMQWSVSYILRYTVVSSGSNSLAHNVDIVRLTWTVFLVLPPVFGTHFWWILPSWQTPPHSEASTWAGITSMTSGSSGIGSLTRTLRGLQGGRFNQICRRFHHWCFWDISKKLFLFTL